ncbi:MAG: single-stranded DNA-binding protein [Bacillaceae bacterium]
MINQVTIVGRLTKEPELKQTSKGKSFLHISLAVNRQFRNKEGTYEADFIQCSLWNRLAEIICNHCSKGTLVGITGRIQTRTYEESGVRHYVTEVVADGVTLLERKPQYKELPF